MALASRPVEAGRALSGAKLGRAERRRAELWRTLTDYFQRVDALVTPCNSAPPYALHDSEAESEVDWGSFNLAPLLGPPSISVPGGFTADGMPAGSQITGRPGADFELLQATHGYERLTGFWRRSPEVSGPTRSGEESISS
jgi:amidase